MITTLCAAILFYLIPISIGYWISKVCRWRIQIPTIWIAGTLTLTLLVAGTSYVGKLFDLSVNIQHILLRFEIVSLLVPLGAFYKDIRTLAKIRLTKHWLMPTIFTVIIIGIGLTIWRGNSPYPSPLNWDIYEHLTLIQQMRQGEFSLYLKSYSDTFLVNTYLPFYHVLLYIPTVLLPVDLFGYYWMLEIVHYIIVVIVSGWIVWSFTHRQRPTVIGVLFGAFVFESYIAYTSLFHLPQTVIAVLSVIMTISLIEGVRRKQWIGWIPLIVWSVFLILSHFFVGTVAAVSLFILAVFLLFIIDREQKGIPLDNVLRWIQVLIVISLVLLMIVIIFNARLGINPFHSDESKYFDLTLAEKNRIFQNWYGLSLYILVPLGSAIGLIKRDLWAKIAVLVALVMLVGIVFPFPYNIKLYTFARFYIHVVMSIGLGWLVMAIRSRRIQIILFSFWIAIMSLVFTFNQQFEFKQYIRYHKIYTHVTEGEIEAAKYLSNTFSDPSEVFLVSEPATQYILEAYTGINSQGGAYADDQTRHLVDFTFPNPDSKLIAQAVKKVEDINNPQSDTTRLFVVSGRFFEWQQATMDQRKANYFNIWRPRDLTQGDLVYINTLKSSSDFELLFENQSMAIFRVK